ncbi:class I SAM-dependent methyltransferase [Fluviispira vulneris]|uniref:class I SAM-dependent methyltransferase n=1 Tax=Fluviispira vulneris TaxID=2763012 RepID=UPI0016440BAB|nr:class I SAM-dependent methyltransferase [Fluviispira vulneris]
MNALHFNLNIENGNMIYYQETTKCPHCFSFKTFLVQKSYVQLQINNSYFDYFQCYNCSLVFLKDPPSEEEMAEYYHNQYLPHLGSRAWGKFSRLVDFGQYRIDLKKFSYLKKFYPNINESTKILDYGCGNPTFLLMTQKKTNAQCFGLDLSSQGWDNIPENKLKKIKLIRGSFDKIGGIEKFNIITLWHVLEHEYDPILVLKNLRDKIMSDGILIIEVPNYDSFFVKFQKGFWAGFHTPRHTVVFNKKTLINAINKANLEIVEYKSHGTLDAFTLWWLGRQEKVKHKNKISNINFENKFFSYLLLKVLTIPFFLLENFLSLGVQIIIVKPKT